MNGKNKRKKLKKRVVFMTACVGITLLCIIIQLFFMPKWENGNMNMNTPASNGVHTQEAAHFDDLEKVRKVHITNKKG